MLLMFIVSFLGDSSPTNIAIAAGSYGSTAACHCPLNGGVAWPFSDKNPLRKKSIDSENSDKNGRIGIGGLD